MYNMSGFSYDIKDVVSVLELKIRRKNSISYDIDCPFCGETKGKMNVNLYRNVFRCNRCDTSGGMLDLYAKLYGVSLSEANSQIKEALNLGEIKNEYLKREREEAEQIIENSSLASPEVIDCTYSMLLSMLTLSKKHEEDLLGRGLTLEQIKEQRYKSVPIFGIKNLVKRLLNKGCIVEGVPGFYVNEEGVWTAHFNPKHSGILIPILSVDGLIQGFQIRLDQVTEKRKYIWLSSVNFQKGVSSGSPVHIIGNLDTEVVYVTEGALKGTVAHYLSGDTFICVAGVNQYRNLRPVLELFKNRNLKFVYETYDMDKKMQVLCDKHYSKCSKCTLPCDMQECPHKVEKRKIIQNGCKKVYEICSELNLSAQRMLWDTNEKGEWNGNIKGIDDLYYEMKKGRMN